MKKSITCCELDHEPDGSRETRATGLRKNSVPVFGEEVRILEKCTGADLLGIQYQPIYPYAEATVAEQGKNLYHRRSFLTDGTGIVHIAGLRRGRHASWARL